ncbi:cyclic nucleotide-binding domain containing protein, partial [Reticulomyxa filosa]
MLFLQSESNAKFEMNKCIKEKDTFCESLALEPAERKDVMGNCCRSVPEDLLTFLTCTPFFKIDSASLESLAHEFERRYYPANREIWKEGTEDVRFTIIASGEVRLVHNLEKKRSIVIQKEKGQCIGYEALNGKFTKVSYSVTAIVDTQTYELTFDKLSRFWRSNELAQETFRECRVIPLDSYLCKMNVFKGISDDRSILLANMFKWKILKKDETLFEEGEYGNTFYLVAIGCVKVIAKIEEEKQDELGENEEKQKDMINENKEEEEEEEEKKTNEMAGAITTAPTLTITSRVVYEFKNGDFFGEVSLIVNMPRTGTIQACEDTLLLELTKNEFQKYAPYDRAVVDQLQSAAHQRIAQSLRRWRIPLFRAVPLNQFDLLSKLSTIRYYRKDDLIMGPDTALRALWVIAHGQVSVKIIKRKQIIITADNDYDNDNDNDNDNNNNNDNKNDELILSRTISPHLLKVTNAHHVEHSKSKKDLERLSFLASSATPTEDEEEHQPQFQLQLFPVEHAQNNAQTDQP